MKRIFYIVSFIACLVLLRPVHGSAEDIYYARCNLKVLKGYYITWLNWQSSPTMVPIGTKFRVVPMGSKAELTEVDTGKTYTLDMGASGKEYLEKFVTREPVSINDFSEGVGYDIGRGITKVGMSKKEAYAAMGPPANADKVNTNTMTYDDIMRANLWVYKRRRFGKNIGVSFNHRTGKVDRTEGIWAD